MKWRVRHNITRECGNELLNILSRFSEPDIKALPKDIRSLEPKFCDDKFPIISLPPGQFVYFGFKEILELPGVELFRNESLRDGKEQALRITLNIDGLPAFHSGGKHFWPILASVNDGPVFIVAIYFGIKKPIDANQYLKPMIDEICSFYENVAEEDTGDAYIILGDGEKARKFQFILDKIIADVPAKSFILSTKGHAGYYSCSKCKIKGISINRTVYLSGDLEAEHRTSDEYRCVSWDTTNVQKNLDHFYCEHSEESINNTSFHDENEQSDDETEVTVTEEESNNLEEKFLQIDESEEEEDFDEYENTTTEIPAALKLYHHRRSELARIPNFDFIRRVPLDYMHLVLCGITKRLLNTWLSRFKKNVFISNDSVQQISKRLQIVAQMYCPAEFQRKPASLDLVGTWKCTQFREFLLYIGIATIHDCVHDKYRTHLLYLTAVCRIMCRKSDSTREKLAQTARQCIKLLIHDFESIYGADFISHNVHNLLHLPDDFETFGSLDTFSSFKYESFLGKLKRYVKSGNRPLKQVINKYVIQLYTQNFYNHSVVLPDIVAEYFQTPVLRRKMVNPPALYENHFDCFRVLKFKNLVLRSDNTQDSYCVVTSTGGEQHYMRLKTVMQNKLTSEIFLSGSIYTTTSLLFSKPFPSTHVGIVIAEEKNLEDGTRTFSLSQLIQKCFAMPLGDGGQPSTLFGKTASQLVLARYLHH